MHMYSTRDYMYSTRDYMYSTCDYMYYTFSVVGTSQGLGAYNWRQKEREREREKEGGTRDEKGEKERK